MDNAGSATVSSQLDEGSIIEQLQRILSSDRFQRAPGSRALLAYAVTETLAGRSQRLSERTVGRYGLLHGESFRGGEDSSVRVQASRLRKRLRAYYTGEGDQDPIRIDLPPGSYIPTFTAVPRLVPEPDNLSPAVLVVRFEAFGDDSESVAVAVSELLVSQLSRFSGLRVIGPSVPRSKDALDIGRRQGARFVLQGTVIRRMEALDLSARVTDARKASVMWAVSQTLPYEPSEVFSLISEWVAVVAGELGDYAGVILPKSVDLGLIAGPEAEARQAFYRYIIEATHASLREARALIEEALESGARSPVLLSMHGTTLAMGVAWGLSDSPAADLMRAETEAKEALSEERRNAHALLVLGTVALVRGQWDVAVARAREGVREGGGQPTILSSAAILLSLAGEWSEGVDVMRTALSLNPAHPGSLHGMIAIDHILRGEDAAALAEAGLIHAPDNFWGPCYRALALAGLGYIEQARRDFAEALAIEPALAQDPVAIVGGYATLGEEQIRVLADRVDLIMSSDSCALDGLNSQTGSDD